MFKNPLPIALPVLAAMFYSAANIWAAKNLKELGLLATIRTYCFTAIILSLALQLIMDGTLIQKRIYSFEFYERAAVLGILMFMGDVLYFYSTHHYPPGTSSMSLTLVPVFVFVYILWNQKESPGLGDILLIISVMIVIIIFGNLKELNDFGRTIGRK